MNAEPAITEQNEPPTPAADDATKTVDTSAKTVDTSAKTDDTSAKTDDTSAKTVDNVHHGPWGDDWREKAAGESEKAQKLLGRYNSPQDFVKAHLSLQEKMSSGEMRQRLPENATDEQLAAWRKDNGIPPTPEAYLDALPDGLQVGDDDKPIVDEFLKVAHAKNATPDQVNGFLNWYYHDLAERHNALVEEDGKFKEKAADELRSEWGGEYRPNQNIINAYLDTLPGNLKERMTGAGARLADGAPLLSDPDVQRWILTAAKEANPAGTVVPSGGENAITDLKARRAEIQNIMTTDRKRYEREFKDEYRSILTKLEKLQAL